MQLFKFCKPEHNINKGAKLQIGTLYGYRKIENLELRDEHEGVYHFTIDFPQEITLDRQWSNLLFQGAINFGGRDETPRLPGDMNAEITKLHVVAQTGNHVIVKDTSVKITRNINNCLIFCMSLLDAPEAKPFEGYNDHWSVALQNTNDFSQRLGSLIFQQANLSLFEGLGLSDHTPASLRRLGIHVRHKKVTYRDRHIVITKDNIPKYEEILETLSDIAFVKPERFNKESEYRFIFELNDGRRSFSPKTENLLLTLNPFFDL